MLNNHAAYKYETTYKVIFVITLCFTNGLVSIQYGTTKSRYNIRWITPYKSDTNVEDMNPENMCDYVNK